MPLMPTSVVSYLASLREGWDSYGAKPITEAALAVVRYTNIVPTGSGGVAFEWSVNNMVVEMEIGPLGDVVAFSYDRTTPRPQPKEQHG